MWYPGFCEKYGPLKVHFAGHAIPLATYCLATALNPNVSFSGQAAFMQSCYVGLVGMLGASLLNIGLNSSSTFKKSFGVTKGSEMIRKFQAIAYAVPVTCGLIYSQIPDSPEQDSPKGNMPNVADINIASDSRVSGFRPAPG